MNYNVNKIIKCADMHYSYIFMYISMSKDVPNRFDGMQEAYYGNST